MGIHQNIQCKCSDVKACQKVWLKLVKNWVYLMEDYRAVVKKDEAYWYDERSNVSLLSSAAWRAGGVSLTECSVSRKIGRKKHQGFCDMFMEIDGFRFSIEAKLLRGYVRPDTNARWSNKLLHVSEKQARSMREEKGGEKISLCFITPIGSTSKDASNKFEEILKLYKNQCKQSRSSLLASYKGYKPLYYKHKYYPGFYSGIILVANILPK